MKVMKLIIVADLGLLCAYREVQRPHYHEPHLELIDALKPEAASKNLDENASA